MFTPTCLGGGLRYIGVAVQVSLEVRLRNPEPPTADARRAEFAVADQLSDGGSSALESRAHLRYRE